MPDFDRFLRNVLSDLRVELTEEFDRNFERKAFFTTPWIHSTGPTTRGSLMMRTGALRASIQSAIVGNQLRFSSSLPYAGMHNEGGLLTVTMKMKKFFWAMYYKATGGISQTSTGRTRNTAGNRALSAEAEYWRRMALMKVGSKITIPQRQFLGHHPEVDRAVREIVDENVQELAHEITVQLQRLNPGGR